MAEKVTSMRLNEEDLEQFKQFIKDNDCNNQAEAFKALLGMVKLENIKENLGTRGNSIESFRNTVNKLVDFYVNALQENETTEQTIREELQKELQTKDNTISNLYDQFQEAKAEIEILKVNNKDVTDKLEEAKKVLVDKSKECINFESQVAKLNSNNDLLQEQLQEYKEYKDNYKKLEKDLEQLKNEIERKDVVIQGMNTDNQQLKDKVKNDSEMIEFYKSNNIELKDNIKSLENKYDKEIETIKIDQKKEINSLKVDFHDQLSKQSKEITESLTSKHDIEIGKRDLEVQRLKNEIEILKKSSPKASTTKTK